MSSSMEAKPTVLITGGSGLIGSRLVGVLAPHYSLATLDVEPPDTDLLDAGFIRCDLTDDESLREGLAQVRERHGTRLASVVHLAAYYDFSGEPSPLYQDLTVKGSQRLLHNLRHFQVEQLIFSSSLLVMESVEEGRVINEGSPTEAEWNYPQSKLAAEKVIREERGDIPTVILRIAGVYDEWCHSIPIAQHIRRIFEKQLESYFFPGDTDHGQPFVHRDDLVDCIRKTIDRRTELAPYDLLLIGEEEVMSYADLQDRLGKLLHGREWPTIRIPKTVAKAGAWAKDQLTASEEDEPFIKPWMIDLADQNYPIQISRAKKQLGWRPSHTLSGTLEQMVTNLKSDPARWYQENNVPIPENLEAM
ncbi:MAG: NAD(P)-dependent oxidoreductase [Planctomycetota bacterium]|nr:MAG: NAD(P)-dependent oxidoreductase [Planctomycetota bacterium]REJ95359.1 MAG: NAD(P)-dependent oxidoreductase [Planctomycetota bacterium]REK17560.1 MAG: NAD(P)-dependent oxidoreductase [Planctomycetota bacterium]REK47469.1 MAG: NAD(P)-dependent oxidoreductase [Planctomycetota bacterium]